MAKYGGETPFTFGLRLTVEAPSGTSTSTPVVPGEIFKLSGTAADSSGYKAAALSANDDFTEVVMVQALTGATAATDSITVAVLGQYSQVRVFTYESTTPTIGQSVDAGATSQRKVKAITYANGKGYVLAVDSANSLVEVLC